MDGTILRVSDCGSKVGPENLFLLTSWIIPVLSVLKPYFEKHWFRVTGDATWPIVAFCFSLLMAPEIAG